MAKSSSLRSARDTPTYTSMAVVAMPKADTWACMFMALKIP
jgi:hypothetical protein